MATFLSLALFLFSPRGFFRSLLLQEAFLPRAGGGLLLRRTQEFLLSIPRSLVSLLKWSVYSSILQHQAKRRQRENCFLFVQFTAFQGTSSASERRSRARRPAERRADAWARGGPGQPRWEAGCAQGRGTGGMDTTTSRRAWFRSPLLFGRVAGLGGTRPCLNLPSGSLK